MERKDQIKHAEQLINSGCSDELKKVLIKNFPELKESEDEGVKNAICKILWDNVPYDEAQKYIHFIETHTFVNSKEYENMKETCIFYLNLQKVHNTSNVSNIEKCIAWLEKQGESKNIDSDDLATLETWEDAIKENKEKWQLSDWFVEATSLLIQKVKRIENNENFNIKGSRTMLNACINVLREVGHSHLSDWLEKQGEPTIKKGKNYRCTKTHRYAGVDWIEGTKYYASDDYSLVNQGCDCYCPKYSKEKHNSLFEEVEYDECVEKQGEQKPAEWNDTDMNEARKDLISLCKDWERGEKTTLLPVVAVRARYFLEHLIEPQKPAEWSEEDEEMIQSLISDFSNAETNYAEVQKELNEKIAWLKSLRNRIVWKPSEEQMEALNQAIEDYSEPDESPIREGLESLRYRLMNLK